MTTKRSSFNRQRPTWCTYRNTIPGWCMAIRWLFSQVGIRIRDFFGMVRESIGGWVSVLDSSPGLAGDGMVGDTIGAAAGASTTTARTSRIAGVSSTVVVFARTGRTSVVPPPRAHSRERVPALSAASIMGSLRDPVPFGANPALTVFTAGALAGFAAGASTAAEVGDSSREAKQAEKREMMN